MTNIVKSNGGNLPDLPLDFAEQLSRGIAESISQTVIAGGGAPFLRLLKGGYWVWGPEDIRVQEGSRWIVNITTLQHGWCCWVDSGKKNEKNELKGERMVAMTKPKPEQPDDIDDTPFTEQRSMSLKCMNGDDEGQEVIYKNGSLGGLWAFGGLIAEIQRELDRYKADPQGAAYVFPVLELGQKDYDHPKWGQTWNPVFTVVAWADINGRVAGDEAPAKARKAAAPVEDQPPPVSTVQAHTGQRRRPVAR